MSLIFEVKRSFTDVEAGAVMGVIKVKVIDFGLIIRVYHFSFLEEFDACTQQIVTVSYEIAAMPCQVYSKKAW